MWNTASLIPSKLIKDSLLSLIVNDPKKSMFGLTQELGLVDLPNDSSVTFSSIALNLYQTELYNGIYSMIKSSKLEFPYYCYHNDIYIPFSESFTYNINLACSKASYVALKFNNVSAHPFRAANIRDLGKYENVKDNNGMAITIVARVGGIILPTYPIDNAIEAYTQTIRAINQISHNNTENVDELKDQNKLMSGCVPFLFYNRTINNSSGYGSGGTVFAISLEKSNISGMSGLSLSGGRVLTIEVSGLTNYNQFVLYSQVKYMSNATIDQENIIILYYICLFYLQLYIIYNCLHIPKLVL
jgi:hypothetical protein